MLGWYRQLALIRAAYRFMSSVVSDSLHQICYCASNVLTPWIEVRLEKLLIVQLVKNFSAGYGTLWFTIVFTKAQPGPCSEP